jgi:hypothetical protein
MLIILVSRQAARSTESAALHRYRPSKRLNALVDHVDFLDAANADVTATQAEIRRVLAAMASVDELLTTGELP